MNKHVEFEVFLIKNKYRYNPFEFNSSMMYRAKIFNQYGQYFRMIVGKDNIHYLALQHEVSEYERNLKY